VVIYKLSEISVKKVIIMRKLFSEELLAEIHIKLDKQGLDGLSEKEIMVLNQEAIVDSTDLLSAKIDNVGEKVDEVGTKVEKVGIKVDEVGVKVEKVGAKVDEVGTKVEKVGAKVDEVGTKVDDAKKELSAKMDNMTEQLIAKMDDTTEQLSSKIDGAVKEIGIKIDHAIEPVYQELRNFRRLTRLAVAGIWAVVASLIASLIFRVLAG
jgi:methyl-accepting chemotaxis protein